MPPPAAAAQDASALNRARDLAAQADQGARRLVHSLCGNVYECQTGLADATLDIEPAPQREHPNSNISFASANAAGQRHSILRRLDMDETTHPPQPVYHAGEDGEMKVTMMPGVFAGLAAQHSFQVMYAGGNRWMVGKGTISVAGEEATLEQILLDLQKGWICVETQWSVASANDYVLKAARVTWVSDLNAGKALDWSVDDDDRLVVAGESTVLFPAAYVEVVPGKRPLIQQCLSSDLMFNPLYFDWGLTGPQTSFF